jgi:glycosyltransferase involved in cell wall biosynthesis
MEKIAPLRNVELAPRARDMRAVYGRARIVLAPSQWREAFGRVAAEAHVSGVPVIASDIGGLPEAVGPGGRLVAPDAGVEVWAAALRGLWYDRDAYADAAAGARRHAARPELDPARQLATLREIFAAAQTGA